MMNVTSNTGSRAFAGDAARNDFYRDHYHQVIILLMLLTLILIAVIILVTYQIFHRPLPAFTAVDPDRKELVLTPFKEPNLLPDTIIRWARKAAVVAYSFDYVNYDAQISRARPYFTSNGWASFVAKINPVIDTVKAGQLFVNGIVSGTPVISNHGPLPGLGETWRVQIPFLVTYQSANTTTQREFIVALTIVRVLTSTNPQGIGIDQFVMVGS